MSEKYKCLPLEVHGDVHTDPKYSRRGTIRPSIFMSYSKFIIQIDLP